MKAAGAFRGRLRPKLRKTIITGIGPKRTLMRDRAVCDLSHCRVRPRHDKHSETQPQHGVIHEKANVSCVSLDCSSCHAQWNECGYCPTATISSWEFSYHHAPDVGVAALRQNERTAAPGYATHNGCVKAARVSRSRSRQYGLLESVGRFSGLCTLTCFGAASYVFCSASCAALALSARCHRLIVVASFAVIAPNEAKLSSAAAT